MTNAAASCRTYIVYHHGLFAQGLRSILETGRTVRIVGMESDVAKALKAAQSLRPEVIIIEECTGKHQPMRLGAFLNGSGGGRVVTLSLDHQFVTVYERHRVSAHDPADLVKAIRGVRARKETQDAASTSHDRKASMADRPGSSSQAPLDQSARAPQPRPLPKHEHKPKESGLDEKSQSPRLRRRPS